jgi:hypothetical protein
MWRPRRRQDNAQRTGSRPGRFGALAAALLAVFLQAFAIQTHVHAVGTPVVGHAFAIQTHIHTTGAALGPSVERIQGADTGDTIVSAIDQAACAFCEALASAGRALLVAAPSVATEPVAAFAPIAFFIADAPRVASHAWRSRAPPIAL